MVDAKKREDALLDRLLEKRERDESILRTIEIWKIAEPAMSVVLDAIGDEIRRSNV